MVWCAPTVFNKDNAMQSMIDSARTQYRAMFRTMATESCRWNLHHIPGTPRVVLMRADAVWGIPVPPVVVADVHAITEGQLSARLAHVAPRLIVRG
jgi:hypothetical protein